ncbi:type II toxin-antitoxin system ParD family antitoxin [Microvirga sp. 2MCAF35]|uniref:type II toxin-antitoxin system ParD family antitoxin n=1 Tax=Microvirga sp. 2MCAF35 TaxID=3232987 RepID=UPI003F947142
MRTRRTCNVSLEALLDRKVPSGRHRSASEGVRDSLQLLDDERGRRTKRRLQPAQDPFNG